MADPAAMRTAMQRLGCTVAASQAIVNDQGIDSLEELKALKDEDIATLCKVIRRPGGTIPNPNAAQDGEPATIPATGTAISVRAETNIKLAAYYVLHMTNRVSRPLEIAQITVDAVRSFRQMKDAEATYTKPDTKPTINEKNWPKTFEGINDYLARVKGEEGLPLAYIIRKERLVPAAADDDEANYTSNKDYEMIRHAPHFTTGQNVTTTPAYSANNKKVADELTDIFRDHPAYTYGKPFLKIGDGRRGYYAIYNHYLGPNSVTKQSAAAEKTIQNLSYNGESRRWNFEKYVTAMKEQHQILDALKEHGYSGVDETTKVRYLLDGIKTKDMEPATATILANPTYQNDFDSSVTFLKDFLAQKQTQGTTTRTIAAVAAKPGKATVEDRYYSKEEYDKLSSEQKDILRQKRNKRGHKPGSKSSKVPKSIANALSNKKQKTLERTVSQLEKQITTLNEKLSGGEAVPDVVSTSDASTTDSSAASNRNNTALTRQKKSGQ